MPLDTVCRLRRRPRQVSPGKNANCPHTPVASTPSPLGNLGFAVFGQLTPARVPHMRFVFLRPWVSPPASFRPHLAVTPLPLAHSRGCLPCRGLSPPSQRPCRAHQKRAWAWRHALDLAESWLGKVTLPLLQRPASRARADNRNKRKRRRRLSQETLAHGQRTNDPATLASPYGCHQRTFAAARHMCHPR